MGMSNAQDRIGSDRTISKASKTTAEVSDAFEAGVLPGRRPMHCAQANPTCSFEFRESLVHASQCPDSAPLQIRPTGGGCNHHVEDEEKSSAPAFGELYSYQLFAVTCGRSFFLCLYVRVF